MGTKNDSAFFYFNRAVTNAKDSLDTAMAYTGMAITQTYAGDYFGSQESLLTSLRYLDEKKRRDHYCLSSAYNEMGVTHLYLKNYSAAARYYELTLKFTNNDKFKPVVLNNKALALQKMGDFAAAIFIYTSILDSAKADKTEYARIVSNLARTRWLRDSNYLAATELLTALRIRREASDDWGINSSYSHLADYYTKRRPDSALHFAEKMYALSQQLNSPDDKLDALQKLIPLSKPAAAQGYFNRYQQLNDSLQTARNAAKNQFAVIRYEAEKSKTENLRLQKKNSERELQLLLAVVAFAALAVVARIWQRKRDQQREMKARNALQEQKLHTAKKLHDTIANGLYRLMAGLEHGKTISKEALLDNIEALYEQSRNISYEQSRDTPYEQSYPVSHKQSQRDSYEQRSGFHGAVTDLVNQFESGSTKLLVAGNDAATWAGLTGHQQSELYEILQEILVNMKKHARAKFAVLKFEREGRQLHLQYTDDGVGLPETVIYGNGLTNTETRIRAMGGNISFDQFAAGGLKIHLHLPID